jgi:hypothetical protein
MVRPFLPRQNITSSPILEELTSQLTVDHHEPSTSQSFRRGFVGARTAFNEMRRLASPRPFGHATLSSSLPYARTGEASLCHARAVAGRQRPHHAPCFFDPPPPPPPLLLPSMSRLDSFPSVRFRRRLHLRPAPCPLAPIPRNPDSAPTCRRPPAPLSFTSPLSLSCGRGWWVGRSWS